MFLPIDYAEVRHVFALAADLSKIGVSTHGVVTDGTLDAQAIANYCSGAMTAAGSLAQATRVVAQWQYKWCDVTLMTATGPTVARAIVGLTGTMAGQAMPSNVAVLVRKNTSFGGRSGRGRFFLPPIGVDEANVSPGGAIATVQAAAIQSSCDAYMTAFQAVDPMRMVLLHSTPGPTPHIVNSLSVDTTVATQRRRLRR